MENYKRLQEVTTSSHPHNYLQHTFHLNCNLFLTFTVMVVCRLNHQDPACRVALQRTGMFMNRAKWTAPRCLHSQLGVLALHLTYSSGASTIIPTLLKFPDPGVTGAHMLMHDLDSCSSKRQIRHFLTFDGVLYPCHCQVLCSWQFVLNFRAQSHD